MRRHLVSALTLGLVGVAVAVPQPALAWKHLNNVWVPPSREYLVAEGAPVTLPEADIVGIVADAFAEWDTALCREFTATYAGPTENGSFTRDGTSKVTYDDPLGVLGAGVLAAVQSFPSSNLAFVQNGTRYYKLYDADFMFNNNVKWMRAADIDDGLCVDESDIDGVSIHELGHFQGLGHSCEDGEVCTDEDLKQATMFWSVEACDTAQSSIEVDDVTSIENLYGPFVAFKGSNLLDPSDPASIAFGVVPFEMKFSTDTREETLDAITSVKWYFGDGGTETGLDVTHEYTEPGNYTVKAIYEGESAACGEWERATSRTGYVRACGLPEVQFTYEFLGRRTFQLLNNTDLSVYGCIFDVRWDIFDADSGDLLQSIPSWEPQYTFPEDGRYRLVLNVGGPAGTGAAELTIDTREVASACNTGRAPSGLGALVLLGLVGFRRRASR
jgi:hypothetical protein